MIVSLSPVLETHYTAPVDDNGYQNLRRKIQAEIGKGLLYNWRTKRFSAKPTEIETSAFINAIGETLQNAEEAHGKHMIMRTYNTEIPDCEYPLGNVRLEDGSLETRMIQGNEVVHEIRQPILPGPMYVNTISGPYGFSVLTGSIMIGHTYDRITNKTATNDLGMVTKEHLDRNRLRVKHPEESARNEQRTGGMGQIIQVRMSELMDNRYHILLPVQFDDAGIRVTQEVLGLDHKWQALRVQEYLSQNYLQGSEVPAQITEVHNFFWYGNNPRQQIRGENTFRVWDANANTFIQRRHVARVRAQMGL